MTGTERPGAAATVQFGPGEDWRGPQTMPAEAPGLATGAPLLYLDQKVWVWLLRGLSSGDERVVAQHRRLVSAVEEARVVVCLSAAHYVETWHRGDWRSRWGLARLMWDVSRLATLAPAHVLQPAEVAHALRLLGAPVPEGIGAIQVLGQGVNHAFASPTGRLRLVKSLGPDGEEGPPVAWEDLTPAQRSVYAPGVVHEWLALAGTPGDLRLQDVDLLLNRRAGSDFASDERRLARLLAHRQGPVSVGEAISGNDIGWIWGSLCEVCAALGVNPNAVLFALAEVGGRAGVREFVRSMPTFGVLHDLRVLRHENPQQPWQDNDRQDLLALSVAAVHCGALVTERQWAHLFGRLERKGRPGMLVFARLTDAMDRLQI